MGFEAEYNEKYFEIRTCDICNNDFKCLYFKMDKRCSKECRDKYTQIRHKENNISKKTFMKTNCLVCKNEFIPKGFHVKTCSKKCSAICRSNKELSKIKIVNKLEIKNKKCEICSINFLSNKKDQICCSKECSRKHNNIVRNKRLKTEKHKQVRAKYKTENKEKIKLSNNNYLKNKRSDINFKLKDNISCSMRNYLITGDGDSKLKYLDYNISEFKIHIESQFESWMSWENQGALNAYFNKQDKNTWIWQNDHIIPQTYFKFVNQDGTMNIKEIQTCWNLKNLKPILAQINAKKGNKITSHALELANEFGINLEERAKELGLKYELITDEELNSYEVG